ncbi:MAG TPA: TolC family protein [Gemmatimonadaceae bacterium]|nr:TolC family protein [Gemmatimonadaceae bacterium]
MTRIILAVSLALMPLGVSRAQAPADSQRLSELRKAALAADPRNAQLEILAAQSALRIRNITAELRPSLSVDGNAKYQSDVARIPLTIPGVAIPTPPNDTYDARLAAQQRLYDPSLAPRRAVERAQGEEAKARVRSALYSINEAVNAAFFLALRAQTLSAEIATAVTDLEAQLTVAEARVKEGAALPSESNTIRAELLRRKQAVDEQNAARRAAVAILAGLTKREIDPGSPLALPQAPANLPKPATYPALRNRPEYIQFTLAREALQQLEAARSAQARPRLSAFGTLGYGRPGLNPLSDRFDSYWVTGIQLQWSPWSWGTTARDREILALQRNIVNTEEETFTNSLRRAFEQDLASIERLEAALAQDEEIIRLRQTILAETRVRYSEGVVTSAEYVDRDTDVLAARLARSSHRIELAQARTHLLTTLGLETP